MSVIFRIPHSLKVFDADVSENWNNMVIRRSR